MTEPSFLVVLVIFIVLCQTLDQVSSNGDLEPEYCHARPVLVPLNHPDHMVWPYFVALHRCGGSCSMISPRIQRCGAASVEVISQPVFDLASNTNKVLQLTNHTSCNCSCALDPGSCTELERWNPPSCSCVCKFSVGQPFECPTNYIWNHYLCKCVCNLPPKVCPVNQEWSPDQCSCACSMEALKVCAARGEVLDKETCFCRKLPPGNAKRNTTGVPRAVLFGCMIAELVLLLILFDIFLYCKFQTGIITATSRMCCAKKNLDAEVPLPANGNPPAMHQLDKDESLAC